ncbi:glucose 1-dehydrogenase [Flindersiella endophytica]
MLAMTTIPGKPGSAELVELAEPAAGEGNVLVEGLLLGICGTDIEIVEEGYGAAPPGEERLVLGHESLGRVLEAPPVSGLEAGDLIAGIVRHMDPVPCPACARGEWDYCRNGLYTERGIKERNGFGAQRWRTERSYAIRLPKELGELGVLTEPASVVAKAWEQVEAIQRRAWAGPRTALVTGAGPIGLLAALLGVQRGLDVTVLDRVQNGPKPDLVRELGAHYLTDLDQLDGEVDVVIECTGVGALVFRSAKLLAPSGVLCLTGISSGSHEIPVPGDALNKELVLENSVIVGSVNAGRRNYIDGVEALRNADHDWLSRLVTRKVPLSDWTSALSKRPDDVKVVVDLRN